MSSPSPKPKKCTRKPDRRKQEIILIIFYKNLLPHQESEMIASCEGKQPINFLYILEQVIEKKK